MRWRNGVWLEKKIKKALTMFGKENEERKSDTG